MNSIPLSLTAETKSLPFGFNSINYSFLNENKSDELMCDSSSDMLSAPLKWNVRCSGFSITSIFSLKLSLLMMECPSVYELIAACAREVKFKIYQKYYLFEFLPHHKTYGIQLHIHDRFLKSLDLKWLKIKLLNNQLTRLSMFFYLHWCTFSCFSLFPFKTLYDVAAKCLTIWGTALNTDRYYSFSATFSSYPLEKSPYTVYLLLYNTCDLH